ncbi:hypothetical protein CTAYLR_003536 [Chrysophaeum taylorii]|uniref:Activator of Hsp90 ATPase AHSA1-like N-terminal domain-containing protein n=1 Tax=Chrysophaeum taylorii TaxID=2483200 RepID=A0AAD7UD99_9STRA|nr:hypothetical protein CTAYLR_003536 [Chrysophaeum taylorii]
MPVDYSKFDKIVDSDEEREVKKVTKKAESTKKKPKPKKETPPPDDDDDDDDEGPITWYKHRETKLPPCTNGPVKTTTVSDGTTTVGSAWNAAGTWEERDVMPWVCSKMKEYESLRRDFELGAIVATSVEVEGDASVGVIRGKTRHICDLNVSLKFEARLQDVVVDGKLKLGDFSQDDDIEAIDLYIHLDPTHLAPKIRPHLGGVGTLKCKTPDIDTPRTFSHDLLHKLKHDFLPAFMVL